MKRGDIVNLYDPERCRWHEVVVLTANINVAGQSAQRPAPVTTQSKPVNAKRSETDGAIFRRVLTELFKTTPQTVYSNINADGTSRRIKAYRYKLHPAQMSKAKLAFEFEFGDRLIEVNSTPPNNYRWAMSTGNDVFIRLKVAA